MFYLARRIVSLYTAQHRRLDLSDLVCYNNEAIDDVTGPLGALNLTRRNMILNRSWGYSDIIEEYRKSDKYRPFVTGARYALSKSEFGGQPPAEDLIQQILCDWYGIEKTKREGWSKWLFANYRARHYLWRFYDWWLGDQAANEPIIITESRTRISKEEVGNLQWVLVLLRLIEAKRERVPVKSRRFKSYWNESRKDANLVAFISEGQSPAALSILMGIKSNSVRSRRRKIAKLTMGLGSSLKFNTSLPQITIQEQIISGNVAIEIDVASGAISASLPQASLHFFSHKQSLPIIGKATYPNPADWQKLQTFLQTHDIDSDFMQY